jgi:hypothetical protein
MEIRTARIFGVSIRFVFSIQNLKSQETQTVQVVGCRCRFRVIFGKHIFVTVDVVALFLPLTVSTTAAKGPTEVPSDIATTGDAICVCCRGGRRFPQSNSGK